MKILKPVGEELELEGRKYNLIFNANVIYDIQEYYDMPIVDVLNSMFDKKDKTNIRESYNRLAYILTVLLNENIRMHNKKNTKDKWEPITIEYLKEEIVTNETSMKLSLLVLKAFNGDLPESEESDDPNQPSVPM